MAKISISKRGKRYSVKNKIDSPEAVNEREMNGIVRGAISGLCMVKFDKAKKDIILRCDFENMIPLSEYFSGQVRKEQFIQVVLQLLISIRECEKNYMSANNILLDMNSIFVSPTTGQAQFVYWPVQGNVNAVNPAVFLSDLPYRIVFDNAEDNAYITEYVEYFQHCSPFNAYELEQVLTHDDQTIGDGPMPPYPAPIDDKPPTPDNQNVCSACGNVNSENTKFCIFCGNKLEQPQPEPGGYDYIPAPMPSFPYLVREKTNEKIDINKPSFRLGKERRYCDYFVADNNAVSRSHADIVTKGNRYFIIDNNSTNKTYVDFRAIPILQEVEIFSGTKIRLGNEDFTFYI